MSEKNLEPTDKKLEDAREQGQVVMSRDLAHVFALGVVGEVAFLGEKLWRSSILSLMTLSFKQIKQPFLHSMSEMFVSAGILVLVTFAVFFIVCPIVGIAAHWGQFGVLISTKIIEPKFDKLNPVNGAKQLFSPKKLLEVLTTLGKFVLIGLISYIYVRSQLPDIVRLSSGEPKDAYTALIALLYALFHIFIVVCLCIGIIDFFIQRHFLIKSLMMSMEDMKQEFKESEGDPMVKGQRKQLAMELAQSGEAAQQTEGANAVVVNPTHFAVAMFYDGESVPVPTVLAKGKDMVARAMIARARQKGIPVIRHVWLARTLYATGRKGGVIPRVSYEAVAHVYAVIEELREMGELDRVVELNSDGSPPED